MTDPTPPIRRSPMEHDRDACPLGDDCDLHVAWMAGAENMRAKMQARIDALEAENARLRGAGSRMISGEMLMIAADEMDRMREYLLETSGRLHQLASDHRGLSPQDMRALANDMARMANRRDEA